MCAYVSDIFPFTKHPEIGFNYRAKEVHQQMFAHTFLQRPFNNHREVLVMKNIKRLNQSDIKNGQRKNDEACGFSCNSFIYFKCTCETSSFFLTALFNIFCVQTFISSISSESNQSVVTCQSNDKNMTCMHLIFCLFLFDLFVFGT